MELGDCHIRVSAMVNGPGAIDIFRCKQVSPDRLDHFLRSRLVPWKLGSFFVGRWFKGKPQ